MAVEKAMGTAERGRKAAEAWWERVELAVKQREAAVGAVQLEASAGAAVGAATARVAARAAASVAGESGERVAEKGAERRAAERKTRVAAKSTHQLVQTSRHQGPIF